MKDIITFPKDRPIIIWAETLLQRLIDSDMFEIKYEDFPDPHLDEVVGKRHKAVAWFKYNDRLMAIDVWDGSHPTAMMKDYFLNNDYYGKTEYLFKVQHKASDPEPKIVELMEETSVKVQSWNMFHTSRFPLGYFRWDKNKNHKWLATINGKRRKKLFEMYNDDERFKIPDGTGDWKYSSIIWQMEEYLEIVKECKWGFSLGGKLIGKMDLKNRREIEFSSCGMPLVLNYIPEYPFDYRPNVHYLYLEKPEELVKLQDIDPVPYSEAACEVYEKYFSPKGTAQTFLNIVNG